MIREYITRNSQELIDRLWRWKEQGKFCDATFSINGTSIPIHLAVMASYSEYFEKTFENKNDFSKDTTFVLDVDVNVVKSLIEYCYKGNFNLHEQNALDTFLVASILGIPEVVKSSIKVLKEMLNSENCFSIWKMAKLIENDALNSHIVKFMKENIGNVSQRDEFSSLEYSDVLQVFSSTAASRSEKELYTALKKWINFVGSRTKHLNKLLQFIKLECLEKDTFTSEAQSICGTDNECLIKFVTASSKRNENSANCSENNTLVVIGGESSAKSKVIEIFDLNTKKWEQVINEDCEKYDFTAVLIEDKIMTIGGYMNSSLNTVEYYDLRTGRTESLSQLNYVRYNMPAVNYKNTVYVFGGYNSYDKYLSSVEKWTPSTRRWQEVEPMTVPRYEAGAAILDDEIFVVGGYDRSYLSVTEAYNPATNTWRRCKNLNEQRSYPGLATVKGILYAVGGYNLYTAEKYDKTNDIWTLIQSTNVTKYAVAAGNLNGQLVITGGWSKYTDAVEVYDEKNNNWTKISSLNEGRYYHIVIEVPWFLAQLALARKI